MKTSIRQKRTRPMAGLDDLRRVSRTPPGPDGAAGSGGRGSSPGPVSSAGVDTVRQLARRRELFLALGLMLAMTGLFIGGRLLWDERYYVPDEGLGYALGLVGGSMMLLAMGYALFKRVGRLRNLGFMHHWLRLHIFFGIAGPVLVVLHSTFRIGSLNGAVALFSMLLVFVSGIMGRYLYSKIHYGLSGQKGRVDEMRESLAQAGQGIHTPQLDAFTEAVMSHPPGLLWAWWDLMSFGWRSRWVGFRLRRRMRRQLSAQARAEGWPAVQLRQRRRAYRRQLRDYLQTLRKVALFSAYERFFAFWRHAHVPFLVLLFISGVVHVIAVHIY